MPCKLAVTQSRRELAIAAITMVCMFIGFSVDSSGGLLMQKALGTVAWGFVFAFLWGEDNHIRLQVLVAIAFASIGEQFASPYMEAYIYRFHNVPAYIPPGHGMVYLSAVALARAPIMQVFRWHWTGLTLLLGVPWAMYGGLWAARGDEAGAILFMLFLCFVLAGRSPLVYIAAFYVTSYLEILGTYFGVWYWSLQEPVCGFTQANPPSGVAFWYCLVDTFALVVAPALMRLWEFIRRIATEPAAASSALAEEIAEDLLPEMEEAEAVPEVQG
jgi:hypothetical protein